MKQQFWLFNSSLLAISIINIFLCVLLKVDLPRFRVVQFVPVRSEEVAFGVAPVQSAIWEAIYKQDLFDTYVPRNNPLIKENLVTPVPTMPDPGIQAIPELKDPEIIPPLSLVVKGIIIGADENDHVVMLEDEAKKESLYRLGDMYKDACILKIAHNRVVLLRTNGQQETFFLRKADDINAEAHLSERWQFIIRRHDDASYELDPDNFVVEVPSLGNFLERINILGGVYKDGACSGLRVGKLIKDDLGEHLGLMQNDILLAVDGVSVVTTKNRLTIFDRIIRSSIKDSFVLELKRNGQPMQLRYSLVKINRIKEYIFTEEKKSPIVEAEALKASATQEREKQMRDFNSQQPTEQHQDAIAMLRKRLLDNLKARWHNTSPQ